MGDRSPEKTVKGVLQLDHQKGNRGASVPQDRSSSRKGTRRRREILGWKIRSWKDESRFEGGKGGVPSKKGEKRPLSRIQGMKLCGEGVGEGVGRSKCYFSGEEYTSLTE